MARRTRDELLAEYRRVGALWDTWRDFWLMQSPSEATAFYADTTRSSDDRFSIVTPGGPTLSQLVAGTRQAVNDISEWLEDGSDESRAFLAYYRNTTGRDWWCDAGDPAKMARKVLKHGRIRNKTEWYLLENILTNFDQTVFSPEEVERLETMRLKFENSRAAP